MNAIRVKIPYRTDKLDTNRVHWASVKMLPLCGTQSWVGRRTEGRLMNRRTYCLKGHWDTPDGKAHSLREMREKGYTCEVVSPVWKQTDEDVTCRICLRVVNIKESGE